MSCDYLLWEIMSSLQLADGITRLCTVPKPSLATRAVTLMAADRECMFGSHGVGKASALLLNIKLLFNYWLMHTSFQCYFSTICILL